MFSCTTDAVKFVSMKIYSKTEENEGLEWMV